MTTLTSSPPRPAWAVWMPAAVACGIILLAFMDTAADMLGIWIRSETYQHAFLVAPISAWLVWRQRAVLQQMRPEPTYTPLWGMAALCVLWLLGDIAHVAAATQFALVGLWVLAIVALTGWKVARLLAFPLLFLFFMVPFGEFAVPYLQEWTADVTVAALVATGIPVYREGMQFIIPSGAWSVVAACSGIRYMIACVMVGVLFAYLNYRSTRRRLLFVLAAIIVPVLANWLRAYTIVMIGHITGSPMILGVEHTTYGWFLFGAVVMLLFWVGARWAEPDAAPQPVAQPAHGMAMPAPSSLPVLVGLVVLLAATQAWAWQVNRTGGPVGAALTLPEGQQGWQRLATAQGPEWPPGFENPQHVAAASYVRDGRRVDLWVGYYDVQTDESKLVTSMHRVASNVDGAWRSQSTGVRAAGEGLPALATSVVSPGRAPTLGVSQRYTAWHSYWLYGQWYLRPSEIKIRQALGKLAGQGESGAVVLISAPLDDDADAALAQFARDHFEVIGKHLQLAGADRQP